MPRILFVDDDPDNLMLFSVILQTEDLIVDEYGDPIKALSEFKPNYYDLTIVDYRMPKMNGVQLLKNICELDSTVKTMILTANYEGINMSDIEELQKKFLLRIVKKPINILNFLDEVHSLLSSSTVN